MKESFLDIHLKGCRVKSDFTFGGTPLVLND